MPRKATIKPELRAAALADLLAGEQPAIVAERHKIDVGTVRVWKQRYVTPDVTVVTPDVTVVKPVVEQQKAHIGALVLELFRSKLEASQAIAAAVSDPQWLKRQSAAELAQLGQWLDASAFAIGDRLAGSSRPSADSDSERMEADCAA